tara:strand:- start:328 stop:519 length:192 start_codon:yes stop_codon:yes gene_type:complete
MDKKLVKKTKNLMKEFATMGRDFSSLSHEISRQADKDINRKFGKSITAYKDFFATLKDLYRSL